eukprot:2618035-Pleurochrysis_carterae.AAC.1
MKTAQGERLEALRSEPQRTATARAVRRTGLSVDIPKRIAAEWRAKSGKLATETELLVIALLMAARMHDGKLDEWVRLVLLEEERYEQ